MFVLKRLTVFVLVALILSCEDVIQVDLPSSEPKLVIDALIGYNENNGEPITVGQVELTLTTPFFEEENPPAENATVSIIDEETGEIFQLFENEPGVFRTGFPDLQYGRTYTLVVLYEGETFTATEQLYPSPVIDNVEQGDGFLSDEDEETEVKVTFTDLPNEPNHYLFSFGFDNFLVIDDDFFQNEQLTFSYFYEDVDPGDLLTITLFGIDSRFADFAEQALTQSGENGGGPFQTPPANVRGNIVNTTNIDNFPFGYFALSEFDVRILTVQP